MRDVHCRAETYVAFREHAPLSSIHFIFTRLTLSSTSFPNFTIFLNEVPVFRSLYVLSRIIQRV